MERKVVLRSTQDADGPRYLEARLEPDGTLVIEGQDLGDAVERIWGEGLREYEWTWRVSGDDVQALSARLAAALVAPPDTPILRLLAFLYGERDRPQIEHFIGRGEDKIPAEFWSRVGD